MKKIKDPVSGFTHLFGAILSIAGLVILIVMAALYSNEKGWDITSFSIFGTGLILLYTFSSLYHLLNVGETATRVLRKFDHIMIYVLIASTYTPICLGDLCFNRFNLHSYLFRPIKRSLGLDYFRNCLGTSCYWYYFSCNLD